MRESWTRDERFRTFLADDGQLGSCVSFLGTGSARLIGSGLRIPTMKILGGNKGALRIPSLSFQLLRRPGRTANSFVSNKLVVSILIA